MELTNRAIRDPNDQFPFAKRTRHHPSIQLS